MTGTAHWNTSNEWEVEDGGLKTIQYPKEKKVLRKSNMRIKMMEKFCFNLARSKKLIASSKSRRN